MIAQPNSGPTPPDDLRPADLDADGSERLSRAYECLQARAPVSVLGDVFFVARNRFNVQGTVDDAKRILGASPCFQLEEYPQSAQCRVKHVH